MATIKSFEDLEIWKDSMDLAIEIFELFAEPALQREFTIKDQILRCSLSVSNNIAEGFEYNNNNEFTRFLGYSKGSAGETRNMLIFMQKSGLIDDNKALPLIKKTIKVSNQTGKLMSYLKTKKTIKQTHNAITRKPETL